MIFYFSATGNSKYVATRISEAIGEPLVNITDCLEVGSHTFPVKAGERVGIVTPTYAWQLPVNVEEFLSQLVLRTDGENSYIFFVATYGTTSGRTGDYAKQCLKNHDLEISACFDVKMPDTWTPTFDLSDPEKVAKINAKVEPQLEKLIERIRQNKSGDFMHLKTPRITDGLSKRAYEGMRETKHFKLEDTCVGCGLCAKKCPAHAIEMRDKRPVWVKEQCIMCLGCLHRCPKFAIQYEDRTKRHGQYQHPKGKV